MPGKKTPQATLVDSLFKFVFPKPEPEMLIDRLTVEDEFVEELQVLTTAILKADLANTHIDVERLQKDVDGIDDSSCIEVAAFKAGFLFGAEYGKRRHADDDDEGGAGA